MASDSGAFKSWVWRKRRKLFPTSHSKVKDSWSENRSGRLLKYIKAIFEPGSGGIITLTSPVPKPRHLDPPDKTSKGFQVQFRKSHWRSRDRQPEPDLDLFLSAHLKRVAGNASGNQIWKHGEKPFSEILVNGHRASGKTSCCMKGDSLDVQASPSLRSSGIRIHLSPKGRTCILGTCDSRYMCDQLMEWPKKASWWRHSLLLRKGIPTLCEVDTPKRLPKYLTDARTETHTSMPADHAEL